MPKSYIGYGIDFWMLGGGGKESANSFCEIAYEAVLGLRDEVAEVRRDNACLEELLAIEARSGRREDFDEEVQQEFGGQPPMEIPAPSRSRMQGEQQSQTRLFRARAALDRRHQESLLGTLPNWKPEMMAELSKRLGAHHSQTLDDLVEQTVQGINRTAFTDWIQMKPKPKDFTTLTFRPFEGKIDPLDHIYHFQQKMALETRDEAVTYKVFSTTLAGPPLLWFRQLLENSINGLKTFANCS
ncbi:hypothetical protein PanWU01x14_258700 [Parasponia andersonii]|uniref:Retrotransposon gag domain-containing protein n=1 Tax=Parasponia andersonii TaxID=3476 RepID=A0A2P5B9P3_PARAD|nr:hypothetical protein PanWU01x14_258700 [Parasponia andersonii]